MASTDLHQVRLNFVWLLENMTPDMRADVRYRCVDRLRGVRLDEQDQSGFLRAFTVVRRSRGNEMPPVCRPFRRAQHTYELTVAYPASGGLEDDLHEIMDRDGSDIIELLRDRPSFVGTDAGSSTVTGLQDRDLISEELDDGDDGTAAVWLRKYTYVCVVKETVS